MGRTVLKRALLLQLGLGCLGFGAASANAEELNWTHFGLRPLGMGNAFVAVADDYNALFYNPAGLARLKEWSGEFLNPSFEVSANTLNFINDATKLASGGSDSTDKTLDFLEKNTGKTIHGAIGWTPHLVFPGFGFGIGTDFNATMAVHREISADVDVGPRVIIPFDFATNFLEDRLSVGAGVKLVAQGGVNHEFSMADLAALSKSSNDTTAGTTAPKLSDFVQGGYGIGSDFGILFTPIKTMAPTLGVSITDFGGTPFTKMNVQGEATAAPKTRLPSVNTGVSLRPWESHGMYLLTAMDADATNQPVHYSKKFNLGAEFGLGSILKLDAGLHQGEFSGGLQFDVFLFTLRFVTYTEQLGTVAGQDKDLEDRRYALQLKLLI